MKINSIEKESVTYYSFEDICNFCQVNHSVREWSKIKKKDYVYTCLLYTSDAADE